MTETQLIKYYNYELPYPNNANDSSKVMENIKFLYKKMQLCTRNVSYFDLYKINAVVSQASELQSTINALPAYSSLIVNTHADLGEGNVYDIGDLVVKHNDNTTSTIKAQRGGIFYPSSIQKETEDPNNFSYTINFLYQSVAPVEGESIAEKNDETGIWAADYAQNITFKGIKDGVSVSPYNQTYTYSAGDIMFINAAMINGEKIKPIIHAYHQLSNGSIEEVYADQDILEVDGGFELQIDANKIISKVVVK